MQVMMGEREQWVWIALGPIVVLVCLRLDRLSANWLIAAAVGIFAIRLGYLYGRERLAVDRPRLRDWLALLSNLRFSRGRKVQ